MLSLEKRRFQGDFMAAFQYLKGTLSRREDNFLHGQVAIGLEGMFLN